MARIAETEETLTIEPPFVACKGSITAFMPRNTPSWFIRKCCSISAALVSTRVFGLNIAALLTRASSLPSLQRFRDDPCPGRAVGDVVVKKEGGVAEVCGDLLAAFLSVIATRAPSAKNSLASAPLTAGRAGDDRHLPLSRPMDFPLLLVPDSAHAMAREHICRIRIPDDFCTSSGICMASRSAWFALAF